MDPSHVGLWLCGWVDQHLGRSNLVENDLGHCEGDGFKPGEGKAVRLLFRWLGFDV